MSWVVAQFAPLIVVTGIFVACGVLAVIIAYGFFKPVKSFGWEVRPSWVPCPHCSGGVQRRASGVWGPVPESQRDRAGTGFEPLGANDRDCPQCAGMGGHWTGGRR